MNDQTSQDNLFISRLTEIIKANLANEHLGAKELALKAGINRSKLSRRVFNITGRTILQLIRETRLHIALEMLKNEDITASEVAYKTGFSSPAYFNTCFHEFYGFPPGKVKKNITDLRKNNSTELLTLKDKKRYKQRLLLKILPGVLITGILFLLFIYPGYLGISKQDNMEILRSTGEKISVAVIPFQNMTGDSAWNIWQNGIQDILITYLSNFPEVLKVRQTGPVYNVIQSSGLSEYASITRSSAKNISKKLDADLFVFGNIKKAGSMVRLNAKLIDSETEEILRTFELDGTSEGVNLFRIIDSLKHMLADYLIISDLTRKAHPGLQEIGTASPEAYRFFIYGQNAYFNRDYNTSINWFSKAIAKDSTFTYAILYNALSYGNLVRFEEAREWCLKAYRKRDQMSVYLSIYTDYVYSRFYETPHESIKYLEQLLGIDDQSPQLWLQLCNRYGFLEKYDKAIPAGEKSLELYNRMGIKPFSVTEHVLLGAYYHETGDFKKEKMHYRIAASDFPDDPFLVRRQAVLALTEGDTAGANKHIRKYLNLRRENSPSPASLKLYTANIYWFAGLLDEAEKYFREMLELDPDHPLNMNAFAWFLIDTGRNIDEGLELNEKVDEMLNGYMGVWDCQGWGLFKKGLYNESLELLEKAYKTYLNPDLKYIVGLHLNELQKAIEARNNSLDFIPSLKIRTITQFCMTGNIFF